MNLGIEGRSAIVCAASQGLSNACLSALVAEGVNVTINGRDSEKLSVEADKIRTLTNTVFTPIAADENTETGR
jgi:3-oxoacyl-[acyl-carrier protein] reductase